MFRGLPTISLPLVQLFATPYLFTVPSYQRPYSWTVIEAEQLLDDVLLAAGLEADEPAMPDYCLGAILLLDNQGTSQGTAPPDPKDPPRAFDIVDGQQRVVTLAMLACILRDFEDMDGPLGNATLADQLDGMVALANDPAARKRLRLPQAEQAFLEAHVFARHARAKALDVDGYLPTQMKAVYDRLTREVEGIAQPQRGRLARYLIEDCHVVVIITRDIDGAHRLFTVLNERGRPLDRKDILKAELMRTVSDVEAERAFVLWETAQTNLGREFETFFSHLRMIHGNQRLPIIAGMRALVREKGSMPFLEQMVSPLADALHRVRTFDTAPAIVANRPLYGAMVSLRRLGKLDWVPAAMLAMTHTGDPATSGALLIEIERFAFMLRLLQLGSDKRERRFAQVITTLKTGPRSALASPAFEITREEQKTICHHLKDIHKRNAPLAKLLLMRIEDEMSGTPLTVDPADLSIEHVLPSRPSQSSEWRQIFPDNDVREQCQSSLGNLALITPRQNDKAKNKDFKAKVAIYREAEPGIPVFASNATILASTVWRAEEIRAREAAMLDLIGTLWKFDTTAARMNGKPPRA